MRRSPRDQHLLDCAVDRQGSTPPTASLRRRASDPAGTGHRSRTPETPRAPGDRSRGSWSCGARTCCSGGLLRSRSAAVRRPPPVRRPSRRRGGRRGARSWMRRRAVKRGNRARAHVLHGRRGPRGAHSFPPPDPSPRSDASGRRSPLVGRGLPYMLGLAARVTALRFTDRYRSIAFDAGAWSAANRRCSSTSRCNLWKRSSTQNCYARTMAGDEKQIRPRPWLLVTASAGGAGSLRVAIWRKLRSLGALYLHQSVCVLPARPEVEREIRRLVDRVRANGEPPGCCASASMTAPKRRSSSPSSGRARR